MNRKQKPMVWVMVIAHIMLILVGCLLFRALSKTTIFAWVFITVLPVYLLVCLVVCGYWFFNSAERFWAEHEWISEAIGIGGFLGCAFVVTSGIRYLLWFIPEGWTYETDGGEIAAIRDSVASVIGVLTAICFVCLFTRTQKVHRENKELRNELEIVEESIAQLKAQM